MSRHRSLAPLLALTLLAAGAAPIAAQDATASCAAPSLSTEVPAVPGGNEALNGPQPGPAPTGTPILCWTGTDGGAVLGTRAFIVGLEVLTLTDAGDAIAFAPDGTEIWRVNLVPEGNGMLGGLATDGTTIYVGTPTGLVALSAVDGSTLWTFAIDPGPQAALAGVYSPVIAGSSVIASVYSSDSRRSLDRQLIALDRGTGSQVWAQELSPGQPAGPLTADATTVAVVEGDNTLVLRDVVTGDDQLRVAVEDLGNATVTPVVLTRDDLIVGLAGGTVTTRTRADGTERWSMAASSRLVASITVNGAFAFVNGVTTLYAVDAGTGAPAWEAPIQESPPPFAYQPIPAVVDGLIIVGTTDINATGALQAFDAATGAQAWRVDVDMYGAIFSPVVAGERIYAPSFDLVGSGGLLAFGMPG